MCIEVDIEANYGLKSVLNLGFIFTGLPFSSICH